MSELPDILVVCTGNTCRSPMGARLLAHALEAEGEPLKNLTVASAGVSAYAGDPPSGNSVKALKKVGLDLSTHRSRRVAPPMLEHARVIIAMTEGHREHLRSLFPDLETPVVLFREHMKDTTPQVPDPFGSTLDAYEDTRDALAEAVPSLIAYLRTIFDREPPERDPDRP